MKSRLSIVMVLAVMSLITLLVIVLVPRTAPRHESTWRTASPAAEEAVLVGAGDIAECPAPHDEETAELLDEVVAEHPDAVVFTTGDNAYPHGRYVDLVECYGPSWGRHKERTRPAVGNHDFGEEQGSGHYRYWGEAGGPFDLYYYAYELGAWQVIVLNSECHRVGCLFGDSDGRQVEWLHSQLNQSDTECTVAIWHNPRWSSGRYDNDARFQTFWEVLYEHGAEIVLNGHEHLYERFAPFDPWGEVDEERGIRQFTVGTGGGNLRGFEDVKPGSEARGSAHGVLKLVLGDGTYEWEFLSVDGSFEDAGTGTCH
jgi:acid phosphatase type 7